MYKMSVCCVHLRKVEQINIFLWLIKLIKIRVDNCMLFSTVIKTKHIILM